jgi:hypothetical protein
MPTHIDYEPLTTPIVVENNAINFLNFANTSWAKWFGQIRAALLRPTQSVNVSFPSTAPGFWSSFTVNFPRGTTSPGDVPLIGAPLPPPGCSFSASIGAADTVSILFHNSGPTAQAFPAARFTVTILTK